MTTTRSAKLEAAHHEEIVFLDTLLYFLDARLRAPQSGIVACGRAYATLLADRAVLTRGRLDAMLKGNGCDFNDDTSSGSAGTFIVPRGAYWTVSRVNGTS